MLKHANKHFKNPNCTMISFDNSSHFTYLQANNHEMCVKSA